VGTGLLLRDYIIKVKELPGHRHLTTTPDLRQAPTVNCGEREPFAGDVYYLDFFVVGTGRDLRGVDARDRARPAGKPATRGHRAEVFRASPAAAAQLIESVGERGSV
jgi:hypothetical protein